MKWLIQLFSSLAALNFAVAEPEKDVITLKLEKEEGVGGRSIANEVRRLPPAQQSKIIEDVVQKIPTMEPVPNRWFTKIDYLRVASGLLAELGTDDQILKVFSNLSSLGPAEADAAYALAACKGPEGAAIIEALAMERIPRLAVAPRELRETEDLAGSIFQLMSAAALSDNPNTQAVAERIRAEFARHFTDEKGKKAIAAMDYEILKDKKAKDLRPKPPPPNPPPSPNHKDTPVETPSKNSDEWVLWTIAGLMVIGKLALVFMRKTED